uniref:Uncharacterized protein n=1 Tax=Moniliophthora roreri TaxID=221103 RepID=A0A0W0FED8_MONRR
MRTFYLVIPLAFLAHACQGQVGGPVIEAVPPPQIPVIQWSKASRTNYSGSAIFLPGHPKRRGEESACMQIPQGQCSDDEPVRQAEHIAISKDGSLLAVSELHSSEILIYETATMKLRQVLDARHGENTIYNLVFTGGPRPKLVVDSFGGSQRVSLHQRISKIFDLDEELDKRTGLEVAIAGTFEAIYGVTEEYMPWGKEYLSRNMVSNLVSEVRFQKDLAEGKVLLGSTSERVLSHDGTFAIFLNYPYNITIVDFIRDVPQERFSIPFTYKEHRPIFPTVQLYPKPSVANRSFVAVLLLDERKLHILDAQTGDIENAGVEAIVFSPDGRFAAIPGGFIRGPQVVWEVESGAVAYSIPLDGSEVEPYQDVSFSPNGKSLLLTTQSYTIEGDQASVSVYDAMSGKKLHDWNVTDLISRATPAREEFGTDQLSYYRMTSGTFLHSANGFVVTSIMDGSIALYDPSTNREGWLPSPKIDTNDTGTDGLWISMRAPEITLSPDGKTLYSVDVDGRIRVWKLDD